VRTAVSAALGTWSSGIGHETAGRHYRGVQEVHRDFEPTGHGRISQQAGGQVPAPVHLQGRLGREGLAAARKATLEGLVASVAL